MDIHRNGDEPRTRAPESTFTGDVTIGGYFRRADPSRLAGAVADFPPSARTPWKVNPVGQTVIVTDGVGWAQEEGGPIVEIHVGDVIWFAPGVRHWEGATPDLALSYVAVQEEPAGSGVRFLEPVSDETYLVGPQT